MTPDEIPSGWRSGFVLWSWEAFNPCGWREEVGYLEFKMTMLPVLEERKRLLLWFVFGGEEANILVVCTVQSFTGGFSREGTIARMQEERVEDFACLWYKVPGMVFCFQCC
ncbi:hypothetical protein SK128_016347 [Halocaridina rubra]|uniref:Uncharacterized protein n=1 Tax=Halocaridina rubra TaxID=373956 RepID=A0AAN8WKD9_HALRR